MTKVKHLVLVKFKPEATPEQIDQTFEAWLEVSETVPGIEDYVAGPNNSPEGLSQGYTHAVVMTFTDATARDTYLTHPDHERFKTEHLPRVDSVAVVDFEV